MFKFFLYFLIVLQTILVTLLILVILLQKGDDGGVGQTFMRNQMIYNRADNLMIRKLTIILATLTMGGCLLMSVMFYTNTKKNPIKGEVARKLMFKY